MQSSPRAKTRFALVLGVPVLMLCLAAGAAFLRSAAVASAAAGGAPAHSALSAGSPGDWTTYLADNQRRGFNGDETVINLSTATNLKLQWSYADGSVISTQPVVANGVVFWGSWDGLEHATNASTGVQLWSANLGKTVDTNPACSPQSVGVASTATVSTVTINGTATSVVFVGGGNAHFYALNAASGKVIWQVSLGSSPSHFIWGSSTVYNGSVYIGVASFGDCPLVQGQLVKLNASTGAVQSRFNVVPSGCTGGTIWSTPSIDPATGLLYLPTGNNGKC